MEAIPHLDSHTKGCLSKCMLKEHPSKQETTPNL